MAPRAPRRPACARRSTRLTESVVRALLRSRPGGGTFHIEDVQDQVELGLMRGGHHEVARAYVLYRERRTQERARQVQVAASPPGRPTARDRPRPAGAAGHGRAEGAGRVGLRRPGCRRAAEPILAETRRNLYDGVPIDEVYKAAILAARTLIEKDPAYTRATARLLLHTIRREILGGEVTQAQMAERYAEYFPQFIKKGVRGRTAGREAAAVRPGPLGAALRRRAATCSSTTWACRPCTTATSCTSTSSASRCRRPSSCAWPWAWR
jgi:ribonucleoside-diphosphate reductase alpha chain